ncbi:uncharacterized protein LOC101846560 [Aplysia californica]|uniref:Uncharacterized protein LOC101846560 n=1 Tax=Aplysia californica TaxID=6500 RepID=A0ABM1W5C4_APLCA|nr:uncharacterized protein LOC101846560 [Aplysia californica]
MASTRKTSRLRSSTDQAPSPSSSSKRRKINSPLSNTTIAAAEFSEDVSQTPSEGTLMDIEIEEAEDIEVVEELVTVDVLECPEIETETILTVDASADDSIASDQAAVSTPGTDQTAAEDNSEAEKPSSVFVFKDPNFVHSSKGPGGNKRTRVWKNLKQIIAAERSLPWGPDAVTYGSIDAPPSFKPAKKYSDISGLESKYTDPQTRMRYTNADEYRRIRMLPADIVAGCLALRKATNPVP